STFAQKKGTGPLGIATATCSDSTSKGSRPLFWALLSGRITGRHRDSGKRWPTPGRAVLQRELPPPCAKPEVGSPERRPCHIPPGSTAAAGRRSRARGGGDSRAG